MPSFQSSREVRFTPQQMFDLVADIEAYPQFLPLCEDVTMGYSLINNT
jgi:coenzyme Q-binding protein COQ10